MKWLGIAYCYIWYYLAWGDTRLRRPYTFIMRDHPWIFWGIVTPLMGIIVGVSPAWLRYIVIALYFMVLAHLWWGSKHIVGEQEEPTFDPLHPVSSYKAIQISRKVRHDRKNRP